MLHRLTSLEPRHYGGVFNIQKSIRNNAVCLSHRISPDASRTIASRHRSAACRDCGKFGVRKLYAFLQGVFKTLPPFTFGISEKIYVNLPAPRRKNVATTAASFLFVNEQGRTENDTVLRSLWRAHARARNEQDKKFEYVRREFTIRK